MKANLMLRWVVPSLMVSLGCATTRLVRAPGEGGRSWVELKSPNFTLVTDLSVQDARKGIQRLEQTRLALEAATGLQGHMPDEDLRVLVLSDCLDFQGVFSTSTGGAFFSGFHPSVFMCGAPDSWEVSHQFEGEWAYSPLKHELTHHLTSYVFIHQPRWLSEGFAQYFETLQLSRDGTSAVMGLPNMRALGMYNRVHVSMADLFAWGHDPNIGEAKKLGLYGAGWLLVHYLINERVEPFADYQRRLSNGDNPSLAWYRSFPNLSLSELPTLLEKYRKYGRFSAPTIPVPISQEPYAERKLSDGEVHAIWAELNFYSSGMFGDKRKLQIARTEISTALLLDGANAAILKLGAILTSDSKEGLAMAYQATELHPENGAGWLFLANVLSKSAGNKREIEQALLKAVQFSPKDATALNSLANVYMEQGELKRARELIERAVRLAPWDADAVDTYAEVLFKEGHCQQAVAMQLRAIDRLTDRVQKETAALFRERLEKYKAACDSPLK